jgi:hypothetical protein
MRSSDLASSTPGVLRTHSPKTRRESKPLKLLSSHLVDSVRADTDPLTEVLSSEAFNHRFLNEASQKIHIQIH